MMYMPALFEDDFDTMMNEFDREFNHEMNKKTHYLCSNSKYLFLFHTVLSALYFRDQNNLIVIQLLESRWGNICFDRFRS